jgi:NCS1 family nucleobase:cation symporter-1
MWNIPDLFTEGGIYWFWNGVNWRAYTAYFAGMVWALPGFVQAVGGPELAVGWYHLYQISFFFGYAVSGGLFYRLNFVSPPQGLHEQVDFVLEGRDGGGVEITESEVSGKHSKSSEGIV